MDLEVTSQIVLQKIHLGLSPRLPTRIVMSNTSKYRLINLKTIKVKKIPRSQTLIDSITQGCYCITKKLKQ